MKVRIAFTDSGTVEQQIAEAEIADLSTHSIAAGLHMIERRDGGWAFQTFVKGYAIHDPTGVVAFVLQFAFNGDFILATGFVWVK